MVLHKTAWALHVKKSHVTKSHEFPEGLMRTPVYSGSNNPFLAFVAQVVTNYNFVIQCLSIVLRRITCTCIDIHRLTKQTVRLFVLALTAVTLVACGSGGGDDSGDDDNSSSQEANSPVSEEPDSPPAEEPKDPPPEEPKDPPPEEPKAPPPEEPEEPPAEEPDEPPVEEPDEPPAEEPDAPVGGGAYIDDTHAILQSGIEIETISGPYGYDDYSYSGADNVALDARTASFILANSKNPEPTNSFNCGEGSLPVNEYPFKVNGADNIWVVGGIWNGEIPLESDRGPTYCNSSAVIYKGSPGGGVDGIRVTSSWDTIRPANSSDYMTVRNNWITDVRDDVIENDHYLNMTIEDNLMDRVYMAISMRDKDADSQSSSIVQVLGNVILLSEWYDDSRWKIGAFVKTNSKTPYLVVKDTVVAVDSPREAWTADGNWEDTWDKVITSGADACSNNKFLWLTDDPIPSDYELANMPACFTLETGAKARASWEAAKQNWIDCHPKVARTPSDPTSNPNQCVANTFGGYSR